MMLLSLLQVLLPLLMISPRAASSPPTFTVTDPMTGAALVCDHCPPGTYMRVRCTSTRKSECAACPTGSFTELWNYIGKCLRCGVCDLNQVEKKACAADSDCQCECKQGFYYERKYDTCLPHSACPVGRGVLRQGTVDEDTVCEVCSDGTFSDSVSAERGCVDHRTCSSAGLQLLLPGSTWHDRVCTSCQSRDGADYLRAILPTFFVHQQMAVRRLRHVVQRLPSEDGRRQGGVSGLNVSALHQKLDLWVTSATAAQIRRLPTILRKSRAYGASERLKNKLRSIESRLVNVCGSESDA